MTMPLGCLLEINSVSAGLTEKGTLIHGGSSRRLKRVSGNHEGEDNGETSTVLSLALLVALSGAFAIPTPMQAVTETADVIKAGAQLEIPVIGTLPGGVPGTISDLAFAVDDRSLIVTVSSTARQQWAVLRFPLSIKPSRW